MKLASYRDGSRDGQLVVVSRDLSSAHYAAGIAGRLQQVLDDWNFLSPQLETLSQSLNHGKARHAFAFDPARCMAPLPRAYQWIDGDDDGDGEGDVDADAPSLRRGASDAFLAPRDEVVALAPGAIEIAPRLAVIVGDVEAGVSPDAALERVRLVLLGAEVIDHGAPGGGATAFGPVAVTPDELGDAWRAGRLAEAPALHWNGKRVVGHAAEAARNGFGALIAAAAARRRLAAGSLIGSGPLGRAGDDDAARRALQPGDRVRIDWHDAQGHEVFGAIELRGVAPSTVTEPPI